MKDERQHKNILIFSDGTGQQGGLKPDQNLSNIYKLYRAARTGPDSPINPKEQIAFYDPGLGTVRDEGRIHIILLQLVRRYVSATFGLGISRNITNCYEAILKHYEPGDRIFLFGFSRGAYTARCVADVLALCGIPTRTESTPFCPRYGSPLRAIAEEAVNEVYNHGAGRNYAQFTPEREEQARRFRAKYGSEIDGEANVVPYSVGVFETVAALGVPANKKKWMLLMIAVSAIFIFAVLAGVTTLFGAKFCIAFISFFLLSILTAICLTLKSCLKVIRDYPNPGENRWHFAGWSGNFYDEHLDKRVQFGRHALAIDETRSDFSRVRWGARKDHPDHGKGEPEWLIQMWFAGNHSDIGGSYPEDESRLSDIALDWMVKEMTTLTPPLLLDRTKLQIFPSSEGMQRSEVEAVRDECPQWVPSRWRFSWDEKPRVEASGAPHHPSVMERFSLSDVFLYGRRTLYRPDILRNDSRYAQFYS